jgi:hypothetical protein
MVDKKLNNMVIGEVQQSMSRIYEIRPGYLDYINLIGGSIVKVDVERIYIVKTDKCVELPSSSCWFASYKSVNHGDTIVVPLDSDKLGQAELRCDKSQIFYQIALGAAAVGSL